MSNFAYLVFNLMTFLSGVLMLKLWGIRLNVRALAASFLLVSLPFIAWDIFATEIGHWGFNAAYITGAELFRIPLEEFLFFVTVPFACLIVYLVCKKYVHGSFKLLHKTLLSALAAVSLVALWFGGGYTELVASALLAGTIMLSLHPRVAASRAFWVAMSINFGLFLVANTFLTALPIVTYGEQAITGFRVGTIPMEDFAYNFVLLGLFTLVYDIENKS